MSFREEEESMHIKGTSDDCSRLLHPSKFKEPQVVWSSFRMSKFVLGTVGLMLVGCVAVWQLPNEKDTIDNVANIQAIIAPFVEGLARQDRIGERLAQEDKDVRLKRIVEVLKLRDTYLGEQNLFASTGMGDIGTTGVSDQIEAYSNYTAQSWVKTVCEIGFSRGTSTITYLESNPNVRVITFDIMAMVGARDTCE